MPKFIDLTGKIFGKLRVVNRAENDKTGKARWNCNCACGGITISSSGNLRSGGAKSCGCVNKERIRLLKLTHNKCYTPEYETWAGMVKRCYNSNNKAFKNYGGRGIKICNEWRKSFSAFYDYVGQRPTLKHTIERIDNNRGYFPGNVKWATRKEQNNNRRSNHNITFEGRTMNLTQWAKTLSINRLTLSSRIVIQGWSTEKAFCSPVKHHSQTPESVKSKLLA